MIISSRPPPGPRLPINFNFEQRSGSARRVDLTVLKHATSELPIQDPKVDVQAGLSFERRSTAAWEERLELATGVHKMLQGPFSSLEELEKTGSEALTQLSKW